MIDYTDLDLVDDNMFIVGDTTDPDPEAGPVVHFYDLNPLLHCLSVAGGLERARRAGFFEGLGYERSLASLSHPIPEASRG